MFHVELQLIQRNVSRETENKNVKFKQNVDKAVGNLLIKCEFFNQVG